MSSSPSSLSVWVSLLAAALLFCCAHAAVLTADELFQFHSTSPSTGYGSHRHLSEVHLLEDFHILNALDGEPIRHFHPMSEARHSFRTMSEDPTAVPTYSHITSPSSVLSHDGQRQPFPTAIELKFRAFNQDFSLPMRLTPGVFDGNATIEVLNGEDVLLDTPAPLNAVYWSMSGTSMDADWSMAVLREDGRFHLLFSQESEVFQADPMEHFRQEMDSSVFHTMATTSERGMAIYRHRDLKNRQEKKCGNLDPNHSHEEDDEVVISGENFSARVSASSLNGGAVAGGNANIRKLLQLSVNNEVPTLTNEATLSPFSIFSTPQRLSIAIVVDAGFYSLFANPADIQAAVLSVITASNIPLLKQLQTFVTVTSITMFTTPDTTGLHPFNQGSFSNSVSPPGCPNYNIEQQLGDLYNYRAVNHSEQAAAHHLFTNCWPAPGTVGISYIGWLCYPEYALSISSYNTPFWQTVVHEIGHTYGAQHTLGLGGIMDYFVDSRYPIGSGPYQFHPNNQVQIQQNLGIIDWLADPSTAPYCNQDYSVTCGNGVVEPGEECDDDTACCTSTCTLAVGAQCSANSSCCTSSCQFVPSTTTCANSSGLCVNGQCLLSSCPSSLPFCGTDPATGGCRQSCASGSFCFSGWGYNLNVPDGTTCNNGGTCSSGTCVSSTAPTTISYTWTMGAWPTTCPCSGTENRTVSCVGSDNNVYANSFCSALTMPASSQTCSIPASCYPYQWSYSSWSSCSASCDAGQQTRSATCMWMTSPPVQADGQCGTVTQLPLSEQCNTQSCTYNYSIATTWGACSVDCGGGVQTRTSPTTCWRFINSAWQQMNLSACVAELGYSVSDTQSCNTQACDVYGWSYGSWSSCSATCGGGSQSRVATCMDFTTNLQAPVSKCPATPVTSQVCNILQCPSFSWQYSNWTSCSASCGSGTVSRTATCWDSVYNQVYPATTCTSAIGAAVVTNNCNNTQPCYQGNYQWQSSAWGTCSASCGGGNQTRQVACVDLNLYVVVNSSYCNATTQPVNWQACGQTTCNVYTWSVTGWSACSVTCGGGMQTRGVYCQNFWTHQLSAPSTCSAYMTQPQPASSQDCNTNPCGSQIMPGPNNSTFQPDGWLVGAWTQCDANCGGGIQTREISCWNSTLCELSSPPTTSQMCNSQQCPAYWSVGSWSSCSASCAGGWMNRSVSCMVDVLGQPTQVEDSLCTEVAPSTLGQCNFYPCPTWQYSEWSTCTAQCGTGSQSRTSSCLRYDGTALSPAQCASQPQQVLTQTCMNNPCPHWHRSVWGECNLPCGSGNQTRQVLCRMPHDSVFEGEVVASSLCPTSGSNIGGDGPGASSEPTNQVPVTTQSCNTQSCPTYYWQFQPSTSCSVQCGGGTQEGQFVCRSGADHEVVDNSLCNANAVPTVPSCNTNECTAFSWTVSSWGACDVTCGGGMQLRNLSCLSAAGAVVDDTNCELLPVPQVQQQCTIDESVCYGTEVGQVNGVCSTGACLCRPGWYGATCGSAPFISGVQSGASTFSTGVPMGETLVITWTDSGSLPYVSILLMKAGTSVNWPVGQYIAQHLVNYGGYEWTVGSMLSDLDAGNYTIRVWFNEGVYADSTPFIVADPCGYVACGEHGTCSLGVCQCMPGFSGSDCSVGPCDSRKCNWEFSEQCVEQDWLIYDNVGQIVGAKEMQCSCTGGWTGPLCATPPICAQELVCQHGSDVNLATVFIDWTNHTTDHYCGRCKCNNNWVGEDCSICPISCANGGVPDANCSTCLCPVDGGFYGPACQNRYYDFNLTLSTAVAPITVDGVALARFERTAATDFAIAAGVATLSAQVSIAIVNFTVLSPQSVSLKARFGMGSALSSNYDFGGTLTSTTVDGVFSISTAAASAQNSALSAIVKAAMKSGQKVPRDLPTAWGLFVAAFENANSQLYQGVVTSSINPTVQVTVVDPSGRDTPAEPSLPQSIFVRSHSTPTQSPSSSGAAQPSSTSSSTSLVGLAALLAVPVLAAVLYLLYRTRKAQMPALSPIASALATEEDYQGEYVAPALHLARSSSASATVSEAFPRLPSSSDLEMVSSAHSEHGLDYLQRSISDSTVAYHQYRSASSPVPTDEVDSFVIEDGMFASHMRRSTSMDTLPTPPTLSPATSSA